MDSSESGEDINGRVERDGDPGGSSGQKETSTADMLRIKQQMSNQCFEMEVHLNAVSVSGKHRRSCSTSEAERDYSDHISELERVKTLQFNQTLALHRMQMWHAMEEKIKINDPESDALKVVNERCMALCCQIKQIQQETRLLQDEITELQKKRLEMKRLTHDKMKEMEDLMSSKEHPDTEKCKAALEKGQKNLEKYKKMSIMAQNVLRGILLACKINWLDDPKLRDVAMTLEEFPITD
ncbi:centromere protein H isoform X2 [Oryzias melastigma]|uniref:centromere protein H isoform X2 n=1 Tax=Oryzias melastigma TaxID=30732 RepID=UPI000CF81A8C|nr:centromere protein H isoform X2 [Oryzias melastigma]